MRKAITKTCPNPFAGLISVRSSNAATEPRVGRWRKARFTEPRHAGHSEPRAPASGFEARALPDAANYLNNTPLLLTMRSVLIRCICGLLAGLSAVPTSAQTTQPADVSTPPEVVAALEDVEDFSLSFSNPGFYAVLDYVHVMSGTPGLNHDAVVLDDWTALLERPADFRGLVVCIEGIVGRNKTWRLLQPRYRHVGQVWQLELRRSGQPTTATVILTENADDIPVGAEIRVTGYFVMIRQYYGKNNRLHQAALIVGHGPSVVTRLAPDQPRKPAAGFITGGAVAATAALLVVWLLLRGSLGKPRRQGQTPRSTGPASLDLSTDLAQWAARESEEHADDLDDRSKKP